MNCSNCGFLNNPNAKFCVKCGQSLENVNGGNGSQDVLVNNAVQTLEMQNNSMNSNVSSSISNVTASGTLNQTVHVNQKISLINYFYVILAVIIKPFTTFKEELNKFSHLKNSAIIALIVSIIATLVRLLTVMFNVVRVKDYNIFDKSSETKWVWENLKNLDYLDVIGKSFLVFLGIILIIAGVYYIVSLIMKKQASFSRMCGIASISVVPMYLGVLLLSPLLSLISSKFSMPIVLIGGVYTILLIYEAMNSELHFEGNIKYYFNLLCLSIIGIASFYIYSEFLGTSNISSVEDILDMIR